MRGFDKHAARALLPAIVVTACGLAAIISVSTIADLEHASPHPGDILAFTPSATIAPADQNTRLLVHRQDRYGCVLDLDVLRQSGGSLIVETEIGGDGRNFRVHWAGARTSADTGNCGSDADLIVDRHDLDVVALSAGGYGVGRKRMPIIISDAGN
jgi:hypothetical protein